MKNVKNNRWVFYKDVEGSENSGVTRKVLAYSDDLMCVENTFKKGAVGALHHHPHTQITYVVSGKFEARSVIAGNPARVIRKLGEEHEVCETE